VVLNRHSIYRKARQFSNGSFVPALTEGYSGTPLDEPDRAQQKGDDYRKHQGVIGNACPVSSPQSFNICSTARFTYDNSQSPYLNLIAPRS